MSKTNAEVHKAFTEGKEARNSRLSLRSEANHEDGDTFLLSYQTTIAIKQAKTGQVFYDAHHYSPTTSQHQTGHYGEAEFSFNCVAQLMGPRWYVWARVMDWGPRRCTDPTCQRERDQQHAMYVAGITEWYDDIWERCWASDGDRAALPPNQHAIDLPAYTDGKRWATDAVLLEFGHNKDGGQYTQVLCGFEHGKNIKWSGRSDQLWAAILPRRVYSIEQAFEALKPAYVRNVERQNELAKDANQPIRAIKRQGDLFFVECLNDGRPPKDAIKMDGVALPPGERANHRPKQVRMVCGPPSFDVSLQPYATRSRVSANGDEWIMWARGNVDHPEHPRLRLASWHRVIPSAALRGASAPYRNPMGSGQAAGGD